MNKRGIKFIDININSPERRIGKTTIAMEIVKYLRHLGYKVHYEGHHPQHTRMVEKQIKRIFNDPPYKLNNVVIFVNDRF